MSYLKLFLSTTLIVSLKFTVYAETHSNLSWLGFLKLPKKQVHKHQSLSKTKEPTIWQKWATEKNESLDWLPKSSQLKKTDLNTKLNIPLVTSTTKILSRRSRKK
jgi:hypothetical protein